MRREVLRPEDLAALLSPAAGAFLEDMAQAAHRLTRQHFGRTIGFTPPFIYPISATPTALTAVSRCIPAAGGETHPDAGGNPRRVRRPGRARVSERAAPHRRSPPGRAGVVSGPGRSHRPGVLRLRGRGGLRPGPGGLPPFGGVRPGRGYPLHGDLPPGDLRRGAPPGPQTRL